MYYYSTLYYLYRVSVEVLEKKIKGINTFTVAVLA